jgi:hypothetical protein
VLAARVPSFTAEWAERGRSFQNASSCSSLKDDDSKQSRYDERLFFPCFIFNRSKEARMRCQKSFFSPFAAAADDACHSY